MPTLLRHPARVRADTLCRLLAEAAGMLDARSWRVLELRHALGHSGPEVARQLGMTRQRVEQVEQRAIATVRRRSGLTAGVV